MHNFYFTFGVDHSTKYFTPLADYYVKITAEDYWKARLLFIKKFTSRFMERPNQFGFQYTEPQFMKMKAMWPKGELKYYKQEDERSMD